ncbi:MAG: hypothetical protein RLZZ165_704 [Bacteroidota bacterium]
MKMRLKPMRIRFTTILLAGTLILATGCGGGTEGGDKAKDSIDTPQVVKIEPQNFPVNDLPDSIFGKQVVVKVEKGLKLGSANLVAGKGALPDWLDQITSRESIVRFADGILKSMPDEVEFFQTGNALYDGPDGWKVFSLNYGTRPSEASMIVYGAYLDEQRSYWASQSDTSKLAMTLKAVKAADNGVELWGEWTQGEKPVPFHAILTKEKTILAH